MDTFKAFAMGEAARSAGNREMVFDWVKAAELIADRRPVLASAGLESDWEWTGGLIYENGQPVTDEYTFLASIWAHPQLDMDGHVVECWRYTEDAPEWGPETKWPIEAMEIIRKTIDQ